MLTKAPSHFASRSLTPLSRLCSLYPRVSPSSSLTIASFLPHPHVPSQLPQHPHPLCYWFLVSLFVIWLCSGVLPPPLPCFISLYVALPPPTFLTCLYLSLASNAPCLPFWSVFSKSWWYGLTMATCAFTETQKNKSSRVQGGQSEVNSKGHVLQALVEKSLAGGLYKHWFPKLL